MFTIFTLSPEEAETIVQNIKDAATKDGGGPVAIAVRGRDRAKLITVETMNGAPLSSQGEAIERANVSLMEGCNILGAVVIKENRSDGHGQLVGSVGVSGRGEPRQDSGLAQIGLEAFDYLCGE